MFGWKLHSDILLIVPGFTVCSRKNTYSISRLSCESVLIFEACKILLKCSFQVMV